MKRKHISRKTKEAALICQLLNLTYEQAKALSEDQVLAKVHYDHDPIPHAEGGEDKHYNLRAVLVADHREKTAKVDVPGIAKRKRVSAAHLEFQRLILTPRDQRPPKQSRWGSRPFPKRSKSP